MTPDLIDAVNALAEVLVRENAALRRLDFPAAIMLMPAKEAALLEVSKRCAPLPPSAGRDPVVVALGTRINGLVADNRNLLERAIAVQTRIVGIVVRAASPPPREGQYAASGFRSQPRRTSAMALSARA